MKMYVSEKGGDSILIIQAETKYEVRIFNNFERTLGPLKAKILHAPGYKVPYVEIRRDKS